MPNCPIVVCRMTDRDIVEKLAAEFGTSVATIDRGRHRTEYAATLKGSRAIDFVNDIKPLMGNRRSQAIDLMADAFRPRVRKLDYRDAVAIRQRSAGGEQPAKIARHYGVTASTVREVLKNQILRAPISTPWRHLEPAVYDDTDSHDMSLAELHWLAGWLEGEGSFMSPPPSDPRRPRIAGTTCDRDVADEVARLLRVRPSHECSERIRARGWSPSWRVLSRGSHAIATMAALKPIMGSRRKQQIASALLSARQAGNQTLFNT